MEKDDAYVEKKWRKVMNMFDIEINAATLLETMLFGSSSHALTAYCGVNDWQNISGYSLRKCENTSNTEDKARVSRKLAERWMWMTVCNLS